MSAAHLRWWGPLVLYMALIYWMSAGARPGVFVETPDYVLHAGAYFVLAALAIRALAKGLFGPVSNGALAGGVGLAVIYGLTDEWHQSFVPGRFASVSDVAADAFGALSAGIAVALVRGASPAGPWTENGRGEE